jgi:hypothetical protein
MSPPFFLDRETMGGMDQETMGGVKVAPGAPLS